MVMMPHWNQPGRPALAELQRQLARVGDEAGVWRAVSAFLTGHLGGELLVLRRGSGPPGETTRFAPRYLSTGVGEVSVFEAAAALEGMGQVPAPPAGITGGAYREVFRSVPAARDGGLVYVQVDGLDVLLLVYRTPPPVLSRRKWLLLESVARVSASALARVRDFPAPEPMQYPAGN